jgi:hypothetical protein
METYSRGGVPVYSNYHENIIINLYHPILRWKANKEKFNPNLFPSQVRLPVINHCNAGISPFFSNMSSGTVPNSPPKAT